MSFFQLLRPGRCALEMMQVPARTVTSAQTGLMSLLYLQTDHGCAWNAGVSNTYVVSAYGRNAKADCKPEALAGHVHHCQGSGKYGVWHRCGDVGPDALQAGVPLAAGLPRPHQAHAPHGAPASGLCAALARRREPPRW